MRITAIVLVSVVIGVVCGQQLAFKYKDNNPMPDNGPGRVRITRHYDADRNQGEDTGWIGMIGPGDDLSIWNGDTWIEMRLIHKKGGK